MYVCMYVCVSVCKEQKKEEKECGLFYLRTQACTVHTNTPTHM